MTDLLSEAFRLREQGELDRREGRDDDARRHYEEAIAILRTLDAPQKLAHTIRHLGDIHRHAGRVDLAEPCYAEALAIYRRDARTAPLDLANALRGFALLLESAGRNAEAVSFWREAGALYAQSGVASGAEESARRVARLKTSAS